MTHAYVYIRFSTVEQEDGASYDRQLEGGLKLIASKGWTHAGNIEDLGLSAYTGKHLEEGALGKFSDQVRAGDIPQGSWLVAEKTDRLSRQGWEALFDWLREMTRKGLNIITVDGHIFTAASLKDQVSVIKILLGGDADQQFSEKISERVQLAYVKAVARGTNKYGQKISSRCPGWMTLNADGMDFTLIDDRVEVVRLVYRLGAEGRGSRWIAKHLNENGIKPWGKKQKATAGWDYNTVQWLLKSPAVEGDYVSGFSNPSKVKNVGLVHKGYFPPAVDADLVARARAAGNARKWSGGSTTPNAANLFKGLVKCNSCGSRMYLNSSYKGERRFQCSMAMSRRQCEQTERFRYEPFENSALDTILDLALDDRWFTQAEDTHACAVALAEAKKSLAEAEARLKRAVDMMLDGEVGDVFAARIPELRKAVLDGKETASTAQTALDKARGAVSPGEHQRRVMSVRNAINAEDMEVRIAARLKVSDALRGVVETVLCNAADGYGEQPPQKTYTLVMLGGALAFKFDENGNLLAEAGVMNDLRFGIGRDAMIEGVLSTASERTAPSLPALVRRTSDLAKP